MFTRIFRVNFGKSEMTSVLRIDLPISCVISSREKSTTLAKLKNKLNLTFKLQKTDAMMQQYLPQACFDATLVSQFTFLFFSAMRREAKKNRVTEKQEGGSSSGKTSDAQTTG